MVTDWYTNSDINNASDKMLIRLTMGGGKADIINNRNISCTSFSPC